MKPEGGELLGQYFLALGIWVRAYSGVLFNFLLRVSLTAFYGLAESPEVSNRLLKDLGGS